MAFRRPGSLGTTTTEVGFELLSEGIEAAPVARPHRVGQGLTKSPPRLNPLIAEEVNPPVAPAWQGARKDCPFLDA